MPHYCEIVLACHGEGKLILSEISYRENVSWRDTSLVLRVTILVMRNNILCTSSSFTTLYEVVATLLTLAPET